MKKSVRVFISGIVHGVFFRDYIKTMANRVNVKGFVRNLEDGRVEAFIEGDVDNVNAMIEICRKGSPHGKVTGLELKDEKYQGFKEFKILHL